MSNFKVQGVFLPCPPSDTHDMRFISLVSAQRIFNKAGFTNTEQ